MAESSFINELSEEMTCGVCYEEYDMAQHSPKVLPCQHTFCQRCLENCERINRSWRGFPCPMCKKQASTSGRGVRSLPNNLTIISFLERISKLKGIKEPTKELNLCKLHNFNSEHVCLTCREALCAKCIGLVMKKQIHSECEIVDIEEALALGMEQLEAVCFDTFDKELKSYKKDMSANKEKIRLMRKEIHDKALDAIDLVKIWERECMEKLDRHVEDVQGPLQQITEGIHLKKTQLMNARGELRKGKVETAMKVQDYIAGFEYMLSAMDNFEEKEVGILVFEKCNGLTIKLGEMQVRDADLKNLSDYYIKVTVMDPKTCNEGKQKFTTYEVVTRTNRSIFPVKQSNVTRRYSDFLWLRDELKHSQSRLTLPPLPGKAFHRQLPLLYDEGLFDKDFIEERREGLEHFINRVASHPLAQNERCLHTFLFDCELNKSYSGANVDD